MGTIIYQITLPQKRAEEIKQELENQFGNNENKIRIFFLKEITPPEIKKIAVKITAKNLLKAQKAAIPIFQYLFLLELAIKLFPDEEIFIDTKNKENLTLEIGEKKIKFSEIFN